MATIRTERLLLRPASEGDLAGFHAILSDPRAMAYWSTLPHETLDQSRDWLASMIAIDPSEGEDFVVELDGRLIGKAGLYRFPEIGFIFDPDVWGRGYASEALAPVLERALTVHALPAVIADVDPRNAACLKLLERLGFRRTGYRERAWLIGGEWLDSVDLALDAAGWKARPA